MTVDVAIALLVGPPSGIDLSSAARASDCLEVGSAVDELDRLVLGDRDVPVSVADAMRHRPLLAGFITARNLKLEMRNSRVESCQPVARPPWPHRYSAETSCPSDSSLATGWSVIS